VDHTDEEQLERLKEWWSKNGKFVIAGLVVGLAAVVGTRLWTDSRHRTAEAASLQYEQLLQLVEQGNTGEAEQLAGTLLTQYSSTPYATLAKLILARLKVEQEDLAAAEALLRQVVEGADQEAIREIPLSIRRIWKSSGGTSTWPRANGPRLEPPMNGH